ncbi:UNVERIFIED_CONTAM: Retrovirus-related Pol polyprotein from transposon RE1 [Sesamum radiatum]|uniref:Retrovirus-related Pol polyprotein from transposon RE1 n=1 Tax=Sesamum radiatum TaxID=300843 RepID=A0AAW2Q0E3_SESRA
MAHKSMPAVLVGEVSTSKAKDKRVRLWKRKKGKGKAVAATASARGAPAAPTTKSRGKFGGSQQSTANDVCMHCHGKGHWKREFAQLLSTQVLERSRKLSKGEMILRLGDGKAVATKAVGSLSLVVSDHIRIKLKDCFYVPSTSLRPLEGSRNTDLKLRIKLAARSKPLGRTEVDSRQDEVLLEESSEEPRHDSTTSFQPPILTNSVPVLRRSTKESRVPERLISNGYTQRSGVDFEDTYSPVAMAKSMQILLVIRAWSIYGLKQASRSWNTRFDEVIRGYNFIKNKYDPCVYEKISGSSVVYLVLYVDDILLIENDKVLGNIKAWLSTQIFMKDMVEASYILGIKIYRDRPRRMLGLT